MNTKHPELDNAAMKLANDLCQKINQVAPTIEDNTMPYKAQYILEEVIKQLQKRV
jgi:hypothetical protein